MNSNLEPQIFSILENLEKEKNITIIFAVDAGSRAYGLHTPISDHDIRAVYVHNDLSKYITPNDEDQSFVFFTDDRYIDINAWDITKAIKHLKESNPSILEWLESSIVYINKINKNGVTFKDACDDITKCMHSHLSLMHHYFSMAKKNWNDWIKNKSEVICKKYLYIVRPLISLIYVMDKLETASNVSNSSTEPLNIKLDFELLLNDVKHLISNEIHQTIMELVEIKKGMINKSEKILPILVLNEWIEKTFDHFEKITKKDDSVSEVDMKIDSIIKTYNKLVSETKTVVDITNANGFTARSNYLNAIGTALQVIWMDQHRTSTIKMPEQIHVLLKDVNLNQDVLNEIKIVISELKEEKKDPETNITTKDIYDTFVSPGLSLLSKDAGCSNILELFNTEHKNLIENPQRKDYTEFAIKNYLELLWLISNTDSTQSSKPKDIINVGDITKTIPKEITLRTKKTISELRPKYIVPENLILNNWLKELTLEFKPKIDQVRTNLAEIRQINAQKRLNNSVKNVDKQKFNDLINTFVKTFST